MRITRARYHRAIRHIEKNATLYVWERWLMLFCLTNQEICGVNVLK